MNQEYIEYGGNHVAGSVWRCVVLYIAVGMTFMAFLIAFLPPAGMSRPVWNRTLTWQVSGVSSAKTMPPSATGFSVRILTFEVARI